ncbi:Ig heavy chain V region 186-1, partial [Anabarilius grahami]
YLHIFTFITGISNSQDVHQNETDRIKFPGQSEELHCSHSSSSYNAMLWYKQTRGKGLELIGYLVMSSGTVEDKFKDKANLEGNANKNSVLKLKDLSSDDSAVYFCAASIHSAVGCLPSQQKPWCINMQLQ